MGFCPDGAVAAAVLLFPYALVHLFPPRNRPADVLPPRIIFTACEWVGLAACAGVLALSDDVFLLKNADVWFWLSAVFFCAWYLWLAVYFLCRRDWKRLYKPLWMLAVPVAVFPSAALGFAALWGGSLWLALAAAVFAFGRVSASMSEYAQF